MESPLMTATRRGFGAERAMLPLAWSVGPSDGATGKPSVVAAFSKSCAGTRLCSFRATLALFEEHAGGLGFELHGRDQLAERAGQALAFPDAQGLHARNKAI